MTEIRSRRVRPTVSRFEAYRPIEPVDILARRLGIAEDQVVKLDANENPYGPVPGVLRLLERPHLVAQYPDPTGDEARRALSSYTGVARDQIVLGNGSDELIDLICRVILSPGDAVVDFPPTFAMYRLYAELAEARLETVERDEAFAIGRDDAVAAAHGSKLVILASPNNPTGNAAEPATVSALLETGAMVVVDEAYFEFSGVSYVPLMTNHDNLVILRTLSKWAGLAGLRIGYALCPPWLAGELRKIKGPYNVNALALAATVATLDEVSTARERVSRIVEERPRMTDLVESTGLLSAYPSSTNFVLFQADRVPARSIHKSLASAGIFTRHYTEPRLENALRITVGASTDTDRLVAGLQSIKESNR